MSLLGLGGFSALADGVRDKPSSVLDSGGAPPFGGEEVEMAVLGVFRSGLT